MGKTMRITPQKKYSSAGYPTHDDVDERLDLLQHIPTRWQTNPAVLTALASVTMLSATGLSGCGQRIAGVAPLFQHGNGRGTFGCVVVNPPVCLSEDEARQIVNDEVKRLGISFEDPAKRGWLAAIASDPYDGIDREHGISYVFVSSEEGMSPSMSTVSQSDTLTRAQHLAESIRIDGTRAVAVFYDPMAHGTAVRKAGKIDWEATWKHRQETRKAGQAAAREQLREQVKDFVAWLKAQGIM